MRLRAALAATAVALAAAGCGETPSTRQGGEITGDVLTVWSLLPQKGPYAATARDIVDGEKLALAESGGRVAGLKLSFSALDLTSGDDGATTARHVADQVREAIHDAQIVAVIGDLGYETARISVPLVNAAGILHLSPGATYPGFVASVAARPDEPERWRPSGRNTFAPLAPPDPAQAVAIAAAARGSTVVEGEPGVAAQDLAAAIRARVPRAVVDTRRADTYVYVGSDAENARGSIEGALRERARLRVLVPEALARTDLASRLSARAARRTSFVVFAPDPAADPAFADAFRERFGRAPGPYARVGYDAMRDVIAAIDDSDRGGRDRAAVAEAYFAANPIAETAKLPARIVPARDLPSR